MEQQELNFDDMERGSREATTAYQCDDLAAATNGQLIARILESDDAALRKYFDSFSLEMLPEMPRIELLKCCPGVSEGDFEKLMHAIELGRRVADRKSFARLPRVAISSTTTAVSYCRVRFARLLDAKQEEFHILTLDTKIALLGPTGFRLGR